MLDADDLTVPLTTLDANNTHSTPRLHAIFGQFCPFSIAIFADSHQRATRPNFGHGHHFITGPKGDAPNTGGRPAHGSDARFSKSDRHAALGAQKELSSAVSRHHRDDGIISTHSLSDNAPGPWMPEGSYVGLLHLALPRAHDNEPLTVVLGPLANGD